MGEGPGRGYGALQRSERTSHTAISSSKTSAPTAKRNSARALGCTPLYPIWGENTASLARKFIDDGFRAVLTCVDTTQLDAKFAGREFDDELLSELPATVDPCGERGEFHTFVWDGPHMHHPVPIAAGERVLRDERFQYCDFLAK